MERKSDEQAVVDYLKSHPDFFVRHGDLLESLNVSLGSPKVVSLQAYRLKKVQAARVSLAMQLENLTANALDNERRLEHLHELATELLVKQNIEQAFEKIDEVLETRFFVPFRKLLLAESGYPAVPFATIVSKAELQSILQHYENLHPAEAGDLRRLFPTAEESVTGSLVLAPIADHPAILVLGSYDRERFREGKGRLFLDLLTDLISALLTRQLCSDSEVP